MFDIVEKYYNKINKFLNNRSLGVKLTIFGIVLSVIFFSYNNISSYMFRNKVTERQKTLINKLEELQVNKKGLYWNVDGIKYTDDKEVLSLLENIIDNFKNGNYEKTVKYIEDGLSLTMNPIDKLQFLEFSGVIYNLLGNYDRARELLSIGLKISQRDDLPDKFTNKIINYRISYNLNLAKSFSKLGHPNKALKYYEKAKKSAENNNKEKQLGVIIGNIGSVFMQLGNFQNAEKNLKKAYKINKRCDNNKPAIDNLNNLSGLYLRLSKTEKAKKYINLAIKKSNNNYKIGKSTALFTKGIYYLRQEKFNEAKRFINNSLNISKETGYKLGIIKALHNLALVELVSKDFIKAQDYAERAMNINREINHYKSKTESNLLLGQIFAQQHKYDKALSYFIKSVELSKTKGYKHNKVMGLYSIGFLYLTKKEEDKSINYLNKALKSVKDLNVNLLEAKIKHLLSDAYILKKDYSYSIKLLKNIIKTYKRYNKKEHLIRALLQLADLNKKLGKMEEYYKYRKQLFNLYSSHNSTLATSNCSA